MNTTETQAARPDLSSLPWETRTNAAMAEVVDGRRWVYSGPTLREWWLCSGEPAVPVAVFLPNLDFIPTRSFRDYLNDDAAAWSLMVRERIWMEPLLDRDFNVTAWVARFRAGSRHYGFTRSSTDRRWAVAMAVLHQHADGPHADLIRPLLEEASRG